MNYLLRIFLVVVFLQLFSQARTQNSCNALNFDGTNDYVELNSLATPMAGKTIFTIEFWMKADLNNQSGSASSLFAINNLPAPSGGNRILLMLGDPHAASQNGRLWIGNNLITPYLSTVVIGDNTCHHIAYAQNGNVGNIYIDGIFSGTLSSNIVLSASDLYSIGQEWDNVSTSDFYNGEIDDLRIWGEARTIAQIQSNMNNELTGNEPNLIAYYNFNQGVAGANNLGINTLIDSSPNNISGTLNGFSLNGNVSNWILDNCTNCSSSTNCNALSFDGINDYVELNSLATPMAGKTIYTIEFWMKADKDNQSSSIRSSMFAINPNTSNGNGLLIILGGDFTNEGKLMIYDENTFGTAAEIKSTQVIGDNLCHHIAYSRNGNTSSAYIDGVLVGQHNTSYIITSSDLFSIGQEWDNLTTTPLSSQFYKGEIDDLRIWGEARTIAQIQSNMNNELAGNEPNLIAYYNFNQGVAGANNLGINTLIDSSPNNISGTLNGFSLNGNSSNWILDNCTNCSNSNPCNLSSNFNSINQCLNDTTYFTDLSIDSLDNIIDWQWNFGDGTTLTGTQNPHHLYASSGNFNVTLIVINDNNCSDSITIPISIHSTTTSTQNLSICQGDSVFFDGQFYNTTGIYSDSLQSSFGCDSIHTLNLNVLTSFLISQDQSICQGDSIYLGGNYQFLAGIYTDSLQSISGCDSIVNTTLTINPLETTNQNLAICQGDSIFLDGVFQTSAGLYTDIYNSMFGCDSTVITNLSIKSIGLTTLNPITICDNDSALIFGVYQNVAGIYSQVFDNGAINGCDSIIHQELLVNPTYGAVVNETICQGDSIFLAGAFQTSSGTYTDVLVSSLGCDSTITTTLTVNPIYNIFQNQTICEGDSIVVGGIYQTNAGIYTENFQTLSGCDSIVTTNLSVDSLIQITISEDTTITPCNSVQLSVSGSDFYIWSPSTGLSCITCSNPIANPSETTTYTVQTSNNTCIVNNSITVFVEGDAMIFVPNVFTPNRDGQNDGFNISGNCIESIHKIIYNRWGMVVFESTQINEVWDGTTTTGADVPEGTYFYIFTVTQSNQSEKVFKGSLTLLR